MRLATAASRRASFTDFTRRSPVCSVSLSASAFASPERLRIESMVVEGGSPLAGRRT
jgi:hypothetical protein